MSHGAFFEHRVQARSAGKQQGGTAPQPQSYKKPSAATRRPGPIAAAAANGGSNNSAGGATGLEGELRLGQVPAVRILVRMVLPAHGVNMAHKKGFIPGLHAQQEDCPAYGQDPPTWVYIGNLQFESLADRLLICAQSNAAIDELVGRLARDGVWRKTDGSQRRSLQMLVMTLSMIRSKGEAYPTSVNEHLKFLVALRGNTAGRLAWCAWAGVRQPTHKCWTCTWTQLQRGYQG
eukprot:1156846-Pelagomonas_calceolata.AAC.4